jgi:hypothetical protein
LNVDKEKEDGTPRAFYPRAGEGFFYLDDYAARFCNPSFA